MTADHNPMHVIPARHFAALAAGVGGAETIAFLKSAQLSKRLLMIRAVLELAPESPGLTAGYALLVRAQERDHLAVAETLVRPDVGTWAAHCLRRLRGTTTSSQSLEKDLGQFAAIAAVAASIAGLDFSIQVPTHDGVVILPGLGRAVVGSGCAGDTATVSRIDGSMEMSTATGSISVPGPAWTAAHRVRATCDDLVLDLLLDDNDPYRDPYSLHAQHQLVESDAIVWADMVHEAWRILVCHHRPFAEGMSAGLRTVVPLQRRANGGVNATTTEAFGSCAISLPGDAEALAVALLHEFQHGKLGALLDLVPLYQELPGERFYAPWRDDPRPLGGLIQGTYAHLGVTKFWSQQRHAGQNSDFGHVEYARWLEQTRAAMRTLLESQRLTPTGQRFVRIMQNQLTCTNGEDTDIPEAARSLARLAAFDHYLSWRARNLAPDESLVQKAAAAWLEGADDDRGGMGEATPVAAGRAAEPNDRIKLMYLRLRKPDDFAAVLASPGDADAGDVAFACGDTATAAAAYNERLRHDPDDRAAWAGLIASMLEPGDEWARPEFARAVYKHLQGLVREMPVPQALVGWLARLDAH
ncbi:hypothetical protein HCN51_05710 [Nonomuraea sp. FMUSA5-5]|uniref:HEXXH motif domain-containing protein n=1 Tax=Nonomuraea composti TaxID=2720023 RepID=A0ABX1B1A8_9ACTN|nr:HEXXH motif domain-containing protein [Nonomuraea sp. FMUSA5-5]NJP88956.1 hypothetical protein [Nonomuraea sp. FMUSA5-5]